MIDPTALVAAFLVLTVVVLSVVGSRKIWRLRDEIGRLRKLEGTDDHPEHRCDRCGGRNLHCWCADSDVWNRFAGKFSVRVLCPICFSELVELAGVSNTIWRLSIEGDDPEISKVRTQLHDSLDGGAKLWARVAQLEHEANCFRDHCDECKRLDDIVKNTARLGNPSPPTPVISGGAL